ncbi:MAG: TIGR04076 family protein [Dehalococcoidia bacterium]|jgi:uncharacterized repeat protein (TIGR04076 family)|nr:MAG: TIGR04076 family protein [Dehalococcoidia bacterium]
MPGKSFDVVIKVVSQEGKCRRKHFVGQQWLVNSTSPGGICMSALAAMMPILAAMRYSDGALPWTKSDPDTAYVACPDHRNPAVFELKRVRK